MPKMKEKPINRWIAKVLSMKSWHFLFIWFPHRGRTGSGSNTGPVRRKNCKLRLWCKMQQWANGEVYLNPCHPPPSPASPQKQTTNLRHGSTMQKYSQLASPELGRLSLGFIPGAGGRFREVTEPIQLISLAAQYCSYVLHYMNNG